MIDVTSYIITIINNSTKGDNHDQVNRIQMIDDIRGKYNFNVDNLRFPMSLTPRELWQIVELYLDHINSAHRLVQNILPNLIARMPEGGYFRHHTFFKSISAARWNRISIMAPFHLHYMHTWIVPDDRDGFYYNSIATHNPPFRFYGYGLQTGKMTIYFKNKTDMMIGMLS